MILAKWIGRQKTASMLLAGIVIGALCNATLMLLKYIADPARQLDVIDYWLMGSFHTAAWSDLASVLPGGIICGSIILLLRHPIRLMSLGDEEAMSLGVTASRVRFVALICATGVVAVIVSIAGIVSWIGLIVPHLCRSLFRRDAPFPCILLGGSLLLIADTMARTLTASEIPISILTSMMGAVFLAATLIYRRIRRKGAPS